MACYIIIGEAALVLPVIRGFAVGVNYIKVFCYNRHNAFVVPFPAFDDNQQQETLKAYSVFY